MSENKCLRCGDDENRVDGYCSIYCRDMAEAEAEIAALRERAERAEAINQRTYCTYCGAEFLLDDDAGTQVSEHIRICPKHPMREAEEKISALVKALAETVRVLEILGSFIPADIRALLAAHDAGKDER